MQQANTNQLSPLQLTYEENIMDNKVLFRKENKELAKTIVLHSDWLLYVDENMNVYVKYDMNKRFHGSEATDYHNHWWWDGDCFVDVLARDVDFDDKDKVSQKFLHLIK